ncbi:GSLG1 protein, partial [Polypterus senegalus]
SSKMAGCRRVQLLSLLWMVVLVAVCEVKESLANALNSANFKPNAANSEQAVVGPVTQTRRTNAWKLADEEACREDLTRLCPKHTWGNNLAVLECLQDRKDLLWKYKLNLTTDPKFESVAVDVCKSTISEIKECAEEERGKGYLVSCLVDHRGNITEYQCHQYITKMTAIVFSDYRLICGFMDSCKEDINILKCGSIITGEKDIHSQGQVIACLEKALVKEAEIQDSRPPIKEECKKSILRVAELSSDDFHLDRYLYFACRDDRERFCENTQAGEGRVYKCLFNHKFEESMSEKCRDALTTRQKLIAQDYKVSYSLAKACKVDLRKYRCNVENLPRAREARLSYLLLCLESAVHRGRTVSGECQGEMLDYRRMLMEDFSLSPEIVLNCRGEIEHHCSGLHRKGRTLHCLMRVGRGEKGNLGAVCQQALQTLIQETDPGADYRIDRALNEACESVIQTACKHIRNGDPMILSCLMEHLYTEKMVEDCEHRLLELQYFISRDWKLDPILYRKCQGDAARLCHTHGWNDTNEVMPPGAIFSCLYRHAYRTEEQGRRLSRDCKAEVQRILHQRALDVKLDPSLQERCMKDLGKWCSEKTESGQSEDIRLEPELYDSCKQDIGKHCQNVPYGNAQMIECLKDNKKQLTQRCHQKIFKLQENEMMDPELDYTLMRVCKQMIKRFCPESDSKNMLQCLKQNKNSELMDPKCKQMITKRQITQSSDYRLNPVLRKACKADIPKFCESILIKAKDDSELEGQVISCLKLKYADQRLSPDCEDQIRVILQESALDYRLDPQLQLHCSDEEVLNMLKESKADIFVDPVLHTACALDLKHQCAAILPGKGRQMSCLMEALEDKRVRLQPECKKRLQDRIEMWSYAARVAPAEGFADLAMQVVMSPSKNYILSMMALCVCMLFLVGILCGRITKRVTRELKDRWQPPWIAVVPWTPWELELGAALLGSTSWMLQVLRSHVLQHFCHTWKWCWKKEHLRMLYKRIQQPLHREPKLREAGRSYLPQGVEREREEKKVLYCTVLGNCGTVGNETKVFPTAE